MPTDHPRVAATLLGTGTSVGIPVLGCRCDVCTSDDPRDKRTRTSCYVEADGLRIVIDTGPDFHEQALRAGIDQVDAVLYTHHHFDHTAGIDDLRPYLFGNRTPIPCYASPTTSEIMQSRYAYIWQRAHPSAPHLDLCTVNRPFLVSSRNGADRSVRVRPVEVRHGDLPVFGYRIGGFAYLTDTSAIPEESMAQLAGVEVLVLSALRHAPHPAHFTFAEAIAAAERIGARQTYFVHMTHSIRHAAEDPRLPDGIALGYDGLRIEV